MDQTLHGKCEQCDYEFIIAEYGKDIDEMIGFLGDDCPDCGSVDIITWEE